MSITVTTDVVCDKCGDWIYGIAGENSAQPRLARKAAKTHYGWVHRKIDGKYLDLCYECAKKEN